MTQTQTFEDYLSEKELEVYNKLVQEAKSASEDVLILIDTKVEMFKCIINCRKDFPRNDRNEEMHKQLDIILDGIYGVKGLIKTDAIWAKLSFFERQVEFLSEFK